MDGNNPNYPYARNNKFYYGPGFVGQNQSQPYSGVLPGISGNPFMFNTLNTLDFNNFPFQWQQPFASQPFASQPFAAPNIPSLPQYNAQSGNCTFNHFLAENLQTRAVNPDNEAPPVAPSVAPVAQDITIRDAEQPSTSHGVPPGPGDTIPIYQARVCYQD